MIRYASMFLISLVVSVTMPQTDLSRQLRTETDPAKLIQAILEDSLLDNGDVDRVPPPGGFPYKIANKRIADTPALYAPEIERRLILLLPDHFTTTDDLVNYGMTAPLEKDRKFIRMWSLFPLVALLGQQLEEPILMNTYLRAKTLQRQAEPFYDQLQKKWRDAGKPKEGPTVDRELNGFNSLFFLWSVRTACVEAADKLHSPIFIDDSLDTIERQLQRPEDWFISDFAIAAVPYLLQFVEQRPDIYTRLLPLADRDEMVKLGSGADELAAMIKHDVLQMRAKLQAVGKLP